MFTATMAIYGVVTATVMSPMLVRLGSITTVYVPVVGSVWVVRLKLFTTLVYRRRYRGASPAASIQTIGKRVELDGKLLGGVLRHFTSQEPIGREVHSGKLG